MENEKLTLEGKIVVFKTIAISRIVFQSFITTVPEYVVNELEKIQKTLWWNNSNPKINHETLCNNDKVVRFKNVDIPNKIVTL